MADDFLSPALQYRPRFYGGAQGTFHSPPEDAVAICSAVPHKRGRVEGFLTSVREEEESVSHRPRNIHAKYLKITNFI